jgi:dihydrodipicolinate synthase/N-acetylneuraminate lyase
MASAFPDVVRAALDTADEAAGTRLLSLRTAMEASGQFIAGAKHVLGMRGVPVSGGMRAPLRSLTKSEATDLESAVAGFLAPAGAR